MEFGLHNKLTLGESLKLGPSISTGSSLVDTESVKCFGTNGNCATNAGPNTVVDTKAGSNFSNSSDHSRESARASSAVKAVKDPKIRYRDVQGVKRVLQRVEQIPEGSRTQKEQESYSWAPKRSVERDTQSTAENSAKRQRCTEEDGHITKKVRNSNRPAATFNEVHKDCQVMAVVDRSDPDGSISPTNWKLVEDALAAVFFDIMEEHPGPVPEYRMCGWHQGRVKLVACADDRALKLFAIAIAKAGEVWPGAKLELVPSESIPSRPRARAWIPANPKEPAGILNMLQMSNPKLPTHNWKIAKVEELKGSRCATIIVNNESLEPLAQSNGVVAFGFSHIMLRAHKKETEVADNVPQGLLLNPAEVTGKSKSKSSGLEMSSDSGRFWTEAELLDEDTFDELNATVSVAEGVVPNDADQSLN